MAGALKLKQDLARFAEKVKSELAAQKKELLREAVSQLVMEAPVLRGPYVKSFRIAPMAADQSFEPFIDMFGITGLAIVGIPPAEAAAVRMSKIADLNNRIESMTESDLFVPMIISNSIPYADQVEYLGWQVTPPYHVFSKAEMHLEQFIGLSQNRKVAL